MFVIGANAGRQFSFVSMIADEIAGRALRMHPCSRKTAPLSDFNRNGAQLALMRQTRSIASWTGGGGLEAFD